MNGSLTYMNGNPEGINSIQVRIIYLRSVLKSLAFLFPQEELCFHIPLISEQGHFLSTEIFP